MQALEREAGAGANGAGMFGVMTHRGADAAKLITTTRFTPEAIDFAKDKPIELVNQESLLELIRGVQNTGRMTVPAAVEPNHLAPDCPICGSEMVLRKAKHRPNAGSSFWGCTRYSAGCRGTRPL